MASVVDVVASILERSSSKHSLSTTRLMMLVYLADWRCTLQTGRPMTGIRWEVYRRGPHSDAVIEAVTGRPDVFVLRTPRFGSPREPVVALAAPYVPNLTDAERRAVDHVIRVTQDLDDDAFFRLVRSTYPVLTQPLYEPLDLQDLARCYRAEFPPLDEAEDAGGGGAGQAAIDAVQRWRRRLLRRAFGA